MSGGRDAPARRRPAAARLRIAQVLAIAIVAYFIVSYLVHSWSKVRAYQWSFRPLPLVLSLLAFLLFYLLQGGAWWLLLRGFRLRSSLPTASATWGKSILARYVPGNVFMFLGRAWMSRRQGLDLARVSAAMVYEQALGLSSALVTVALLYPFWRHHGRIAAWSLVAVPFLVALMHPRVFTPLAARLLRVLKREPLGAALPFAATLGLLCYFVVSWLVAGAAAWLLAASVTAVGARELPVIVAGYAFAYVVGMAAFIFPSGLGVREAVLAATLATRLPGGVALAWAVLLRLWQTIVELAYVGGVSLGEARGGAAAVAGRAQSITDTRGDATSSGSAAQGDVRRSNSGEDEEEE
jgi:uncharacterized membrane protein YbhN (UPF0104 family)